MCIFAVQINEVMKKIIAFSLLSVMLLACNKQKQISKNMSSKDGVWNIESYYAKQVSTYGPDNYETNLINVGTMTFNENYSGVLNWTYGGDLYIETFSYSNTDDKFSLVIDDGDFNGTYDIQEWKKGKMTITKTESYTAAPPGQSGNVGSGTQVITIKLSKKK